MHKALAMMNMLPFIDVNPYDFSKFLSTRFSTHIVLPQPEYGLAINWFASPQLHALEKMKDICIRRIYDAWGKASTKIMHHLSRLLSCKNGPVSCKRIFSFAPYICSSNFSLMTLLIPFPFTFFIFDPKGVFLNINFLMDRPGPSGHLFIFFYFIHSIEPLIKDYVKFPM